MQCYYLLQKVPFFLIGYYIFYEFYNHNNPPNSFSSASITQQEGGIIPE